MTGWRALARACALLPPLLLAALAGAPIGLANAAEADPSRGKEVFRLCAACHSLVPGDHRTGPSLAGLWGRKAGSLEGFGRYSPALRDSGLLWEDDTLDDFIADPQALVSGTSMTFRGLQDAGARADLIAFLKAEVGEADEQARTAEGEARRPGMPDLGEAPPAQRVRSISYCKDTYEIQTADGERRLFWEFNLRFKTDSSELGPAKDAPALLPSGMMGDRAFVVFADPEEISAFVEVRC